MNTLAMPPLQDIQLILRLEYNFFLCPKDAITSKAKEERFAFITIVMSGLNPICINNGNLCNANKYNAT